MKQTVSCGWLLAAAVFVASAQVPAPRDRDLPGVLSLSVDLSEAPRKVLHVRQTIPLPPGRHALYYPKWIPGEHAPSGPIGNVTGLKIRADGRRLDWARDLEDMYTLYVEVPPGAGAIELEFQFLAPGSAGAFGQSVSTTPRLAVLAFNQVVFYPAGYHADRIAVSTTLRLPPGWDYATPLATLQRRGQTVELARSSLELLVDSPLIAGRHFKQLELSSGGAAPVRLSIVADSAAALQLDQTQIEQHRALVAQTLKLFESHHYQHYDFLLSLSDHIGHFGLEHHQGSDNRLGEDFLTDPQRYLLGAGLLPHEYFHSWNGKFRRPQGLVTPHFNVPMHDDLLWVYEGLTSYYGPVLAARAGLWSAQQYRDVLAYNAAAMSERSGRAWRPLRDTADAAQLLYAAPEQWRDWRRGVDFYGEGALLWLNVDAKLRELSKGKRTLDDFCERFFGFESGALGPIPYRFEDIVDALDQIEPHDWASFLRTRLDAVDRSPLGGLERAGWTLDFAGERSAYQKTREEVRKYADLMPSLGMSVDKQGRLQDVRWGGVAFEAGLAPGMEIVAIDGVQFTLQHLREAVAATPERGRVELLIRNVDSYRSHTLRYDGGARYPVLVRRQGEADMLTAILKPLR